MNPKFWIILRYKGFCDIVEFQTKEELNDFLKEQSSELVVESLEVISGFTLTKRTLSGE